MSRVVGFPTVKSTVSGGAIRRWTIALVEDGKCVKVCFGPLPQGLALRAAYDMHRANKDSEFDPKTALLEPMK